MTDTDRLSELLQDALTFDVAWVIGVNCDETAARLIAAGVTLAPTPPDAPEPDGVACDWDEHGRCRCKAPTPPDALREAAENLTDRRTLMDDGFWVSQKEMRALDEALGRGYEYANPAPKEADR